MSMIGWLVSKLWHMVCAGRNKADQGLIGAAESAATDSTQHCRDQPGM